MLAATNNQRSVSSRSFSRVAAREAVKAYQNNLGTFIDVRHPSGSEVGAIEGFKSIPHYAITKKMTGQVGGKDETIYLVDNFGLYSECCASILEKELGYTNVNVISGGISSWNSCGGPGMKPTLKIQSNKGSKTVNRS